MTSCEYQELSLNYTSRSLLLDSLAQFTIQLPKIILYTNQLVCCRHKAGHHDTTVHEKVAPAVVQENVTKHRHEEAQTAVDREVHQDHYHTSVLPVKDREVLPEQHHHNIIPVEHREHKHGDAAAVEARLEQERAQFSSTRTDAGVKESHSVAPVIAGEHVHHHVHEVRIVCFSFQG